MFRHRSFAASLLSLTVLFVAAPSAQAAEDELLWRGDHATGRAIMEDLSKQYAKEKKGKITLQPFSTISGLDAVAQGTADIAGSARGKYSKRAEEAGVNFVPVALDAAVMLSHPKNPVGSLTLRQVYDVYYGRITNWKELGGEDKPINLYAIAAPLDGVEFSVRDLVFRNGDQRVAAPRLYLNTTKLEEAIAIDPAGLGLSTLANTYANKGVKPLSIEGIGASTATISDGSYPLYITLYLAEKVDSPKQAAIERFIGFLNEPAAKDILRRHQLVPYADATDAISRASARTAFIDAHLGREAGGTVTAVAAATPAPTPVSAPRASLEAKSRISPTAETTKEARENLARAEAAAAEKKAAASATPAVSAPAAVAATTPAAAPPAKPVEVATTKTTSPAPAKAVAKSTDKPVKKKAAVAKAKAPEKKAEQPASFGNVDAGTQTSSGSDKN